MAESTITSGLKKPFVDLYREARRQRKESDYADRILMDRR